MNAGTGRFWTMDTFVGNRFEPRSLHRYLYSHANPINLSDPSGRSVIGTVFAYTILALGIYGLYHALRFPLALILNGQVSSTGGTDHFALQTLGGASIGLATLSGISFASIEELPPNVGGLGRARRRGIYKIVQQGLTAGIEPDPAFEDPGSSSSQFRTQQPRTLRDFEGLGNTTIFLSGSVVFASCQGVVFQTLPDRTQLPKRVF